MQSLVGSRVDLALVARDGLGCVELCLEYEEYASVHDTRAINC